jgi:hypothetical protein
MPGRPSDVMDRQQVRVLRADMGFEVLQGDNLAARRTPRRGTRQGDHLDRPQPARRSVRRQPYGAEAAFADTADQLEVGHLGRKNLGGSVLV